MKSNGKADPRMHILQGNESLGAARHASLQESDEHATDCDHRLEDAARRLHEYILSTHWTGEALRGPDSGIRFNARIGRFLKSYTKFVPWRDDVAYMQAQGYWILDNWLMYDLLGDSQYRNVAVACTDYVKDSQRVDGCWEYPNREWKGRIATVEGCFATLGLLETYARTGHDHYLSAARRWYDYVVRKVRFQVNEGSLAINYFSNVPGGMVPNNSTLALQTFARLANVSGNSKFLESCPGMVRFLHRVQLPSGELPYAVSDLQGNGRIHFLCYQYNAFELMDLVEYYRLTGDQDVLPIIGPLARYLSDGLTPAGAGRHDCGSATPEVLYYTFALAQALSQATQLRLGDYQSTVTRIYRYGLAHQRATGNFRFFSRSNHGVLSDRRSYPRALSMILFHLLREVPVTSYSLSLAEAGPED